LPRARAPASTKLASMVILRQVRSFLCAMAHLPCVCF
jgi:hypothetical protein